MKRKPGRPPKKIPCPYRCGAAPMGARELRKHLAKCKGRKAK